MVYRVLSNRLLFPAGSVVSDSMLPEGCNIALLLETGHLARVQEPAPSKKSKHTRPPVDPEPEPAVELEEQP
jgi:hypothetical protein